MPRLRNAHAHLGIISVLHTYYMDVYIVRLCGYKHSGYSDVKQQQLNILRKLLMYIGS